MKLTTLIRIFIILLMAQPCYSAEYAFDFLDQPASSRAASMGDAVTSIHHSPDSIFSNPAGIAQMQAVSIQFSSFKAFEDVNFQSFATVIPLGDIRLGIGYFGASVTNIAHTQFDTSKGRVVTAGDPFQYGAHALYVTGSTSFGEQLRLGVSAKLLKESLFNYTSAGLGIDLGIQYDATEFWSLGLSVENAVASQITWDTASKEKNELPLTVRTGTSLHLGALTLSADASLILNQHNQTRLNNNVQSQDVVQSHFGAEYTVLDMLALRTGYGAQQLSFGAGLILQTVQLDVSYSLPHSSFKHILEPISRFSAGLSF